MSHYQRNDRDRGGDYDDRGAPSRSGNGGDHGFNRGGQGRGDPSRGARPLGGGHYGSSGPNQGPSGDMNAGPPPRDGGYNDSRGSAGYSNQRDASGGYNEGGSSSNNDRAVGGGGGRYNDARGSYMDDRGAATGGGHYNSSRDVGYNDVGGYGNDFHRGRVVDRGYRIRTNDGGQYSGAGAGRGGGYDNRESQRYGDVGSAAGGHNDGRGGGSSEFVQFFILSDFIISEKVSNVQNVLMSFFVLFSIQLMMIVDGTLTVKIIEVFIAIVNTMILGECVTMMFLREEILILEVLVCLLRGIMIPEVEIFLQGKT